MSKYLDRLHALESGKNAYIGNPQNPQKPFEPFEGRQEGRFSGPRHPFEPFEGGEGGANSTLGANGSSPALYDPARLQREADRRNSSAAREGLTDRYCRCGHLATFAWPGNDGRDVWICAECLPTWGRA